MADNEQQANQTQANQATEQQPKPANDRRGGGPGGERRGPGGGPGRRGVAKARAAEALATIVAIAGSGGSAARIAEPGIGASKVLRRSTSKS